MPPTDYAASFQFAQRPFSLAPDPRFHFRSRSHGRVFDVLSAAVARREALMLVVGDLGVGKTTLCRRLLEPQDRKRRAALIGNALLSPEDLLRAVLGDLGAVAPHEVQDGRLAGARRGELIDRFERAVRRLSAAGESAVIVVDEAHRLPVATADQLVELSSIDASPQRVVQILLAGQPAIGGSVLPRAVDDRLGVRARLLPLERDECAPYIRHRLELAGGGVTFADRALEVIYALSGGVPRLVNLLGERALQQAAAAGVRRVEGSMIESTAPALEMLRLRPRRFRWYGAR